VPSGAIVRPERRGEGHLLAGLPGTEELDFGLLRRHAEGGERSSQAVSS
jgi:hypothetical protein